MYDPKRWRPLPAHRGIAHEIKNPLNFVNNFAETSVELMEELKKEIEPILGQLNDEARENVDDLFETLTGDLGKINEHGRRPIAS